MAADCVESDPTTSAALAVVDGQSVTVAKGGAALLPGNRLLTRHYRLQLNAAADPAAIRLHMFGPLLSGAEVAAPKRSTQGAELSICFSENMVQRIVHSMPELNVLAPLLLRARQGVRFDGAVLTEARDLAGEIAATAGAERALLLLRLLNRLAVSGDYQVLNLQPLKTPANVRIQARVQRVVDYLSCNYNRELSLEQVAQSHGMSAGYLSRLFKQATGTGFCNFLIDIRISRACELLSGSERSVTEICFDTGFRNISNFNRRFFALRNTTPSEFRKRCRQQHRRN